MRWFFLFSINNVFFVLNFDRNSRILYPEYQNYRLNLVEQLVITFIMLKTARPRARLVTPLKGNDRHRQELGDLTFAAWLSPFCVSRCAASPWRNGVRGIARWEHGGGSVARPDGLSVATLCGLWSRRRETPALRHEGHDPRYDLVKKPFNASTSQHLRPPESLLGETRKLS